MDEITSVMLAQIQEIEQKDENQILAELAGETIAEYIYETEVWDWKTGSDGKMKKQKVRKVKLSWVGTREVARSRGNIILAEPTVNDLEDALRIVVKATDLKRNFAVFGGCHQPKKMKVYEFDKDTGEIIGSHLEDDPYVFQKGLSKAQRNALTSCIPADYAVKMIDRFLQASGKQPLAPGAAKKLIPLKTARTKGATPHKHDIKHRAEWDKVTQEMVPDYPHLESIIWDLCKLQPADMYKQLGVSSISDIKTPPWEAFLTIKEILAPKDSPGVKANVVPQSHNASPDTKDDIFSPQAEEDRERQMCWKEICQLMAGTSQGRDTLVAWFKRRHNLVVSLEEVNADTPPKIATLRILANLRENLKALKAKGQHSIARRHL